MLTDRLWWLRGMKTGINEEVQAAVHTYTQRTEVWGWYCTLVAFGVGDGGDSGGGGGGCGRYRGGGGSIWVRGQIHDKHRGKTNEYKSHEDKVKPLWGDGAAVWYKTNSLLCHDVNLGSAPDCNDELAVSIKQHPHAVIWCQTNKADQRSCRQLSSFMSLHRLHTRTRKSDNATNMWL